MDTSEVEIHFGDEPGEVERVFEETAECTLASSQGFAGCAQPEPMNRQGSPQCYHENKCKIATLNVRHYRPEEIKLKVEGGKILVEGKHYSEGAYGFDSSEFRRKYDLPRECDEESVSSRISRDGVLTIEAVNRNAQRQAAATNETNFCTSKGSITNSDDEKFAVTLDMSSFAPEEVRIEVVGNRLSVSAKQESKTEGHYSSQQFNRHFVLPGDVDANTVISSRSNDGQLHIKAERKLLRANEERDFHIKEEE